MLFPDEALINVQREWNGWRTAFVRLRALQNVHWFQPRGAPRPLLHAYGPCTSIVEGELPHDCNRTPAPHRLLVCILKCHSTAVAYAEIARRADEHQMAPEQVRQPDETSQPLGEPSSGDARV